MASFLNGLSAMGAGVAQFAGNAGLEAQRAELAQQQAVLADGLATARETKLQDQAQTFHASQADADRTFRGSLADKEIGARASEGALSRSAELARERDRLAVTQSEGAANREAERYRVDTTVNAKPPEARLAEWYAGASPEMRRGLLQYEGTKQGLPSWMIDGGSDQPSPSASAPATGSSAGADPAAVAGGTSPVTPQADALARIPPEGRGLVRNIILGLEPPPPPRVAASPYGRNVMELVRKVEPDFDALTWASRSETRKAFAPDGTAGKAVASANTAMGHAAHLMDQFDKLGNWSLGEVVNAPANYVMGKMGQGAVLKSTAGTIEALASEARKIYAGAGGGSEAELNDWKRNFPINGSPSEQRAAMENFVELLDGKLQSLAGQYNKGMKSSIEPFQMLDPKPRETYRRLLNHEPPDSTGYQTGQPPAAASPASTGTAASKDAPDPMSMARDAIAQGAPRDAVIKRLRDNGIDPSGLFKAAPAADPGLGGAF